MREELLHFIWQQQLFNNSDLATTDGLPVIIIDQGNINHDSGPDFSNSNIIIDDMEWAGDVELHISSSNWLDHGHQHDSNYDRVILHVVWNDDKVVSYSDKTNIPVLSLRGRVSRAMMQTADNLINSPAILPCSGMLPGIDKIHFISMFNKSLVQRLEKKSAAILSFVQETNGDWEEAGYWSLCQSMGFKKNSEPMLELAKRLPFKILKNYANKPIRIEALLFGIAGFLSSGRAQDEYNSNLRSEFQFLVKKHRLANKIMPVTWWKFMRLRPANFPTLRIAQLAQIIARFPSLLNSLIREEPTMLAHLFKVHQSDYWNSHYHFSKTSKNPLSGFGDSSVRGLLINTVGPVLVAYSSVHGNEFIRRAMKLMSSLPPENNRITRLWQSFDIDLTNGAESQGSIELFNHFCKNKLCLSCEVGYQILHS